MQRTDKASCLVTIVSTAKPSPFHTVHGRDVRDRAPSALTIRGTDRMENADVTIKGTGEMELKPIHIVVMVIALLHAVAIAIWAVLNLSGTKEERRSLQKPMGPAAAPGELSNSSPRAKLSGKAGSSDSKKTQ